MNNMEENNNVETPVEVQPQPETIVAPPTESVEMQAARYVAMALPIFRTKLKRLEERNKTEVGRVLAALIESPLEQQTHGFTTKEGSDLFEMGLVITNAKFILFNSGLKLEAKGELNPEQVQESVAEEVKNESV